MKITTKLETIQSLNFTIWFWFDAWLLDFYHKRYVKKILSNYRFILRSGDFGKTSTVISVASSLCSLKIPYVCVYMYVSMRTIKVNFPTSFHLMYSAVRICEITFT